MDKLQKDKLYQLLKDGKAIVAQDGITLLSRDQIASDGKLHYYLNWRHYGSSACYFNKSDFNWLMNHIMDDLKPEDYFIEIKTGLNKKRLLCSVLKNVFDNKYIIVKEKYNNKQVSAYEAYKIARGLKLCF